MRLGNITELAHVAGRVGLVSTDVFDTLLLRTTRSERSRIVIGERLFSGFLATRGWHVPPELLVHSRLQAQRLAFRALAASGMPGEVKLHDIVRRQLRCLSLPEIFVPDRLNIEVQVEKGSLVANKNVAAVLRAHRRSGAQIIAISDTTLPSSSVTELIHHFHGRELVGRVYSSADWGLTKRDGGLFEAVAEAEGELANNMAHVGDDIIADVQSPLRRGIQVYYARRPAYARYRRAINGAVTEAQRLASRHLRAVRQPSSAYDSVTSFGREVFGPVVTEFCLSIWLYVDQSRTAQVPTLLFCSRGGVGIREAFERVLAKLRLPLDLPRANIMVSRLVAARAALLAGSPSAIEELEREFKGSSLAQVARALGGRGYELAGEWQQPFRGREFLNLLFGEHGRELLSDVQRQNELFTKHLERLTAGSSQIILCDTGLYGSTQRLLAAGFPGKRFETILLARSNYKGHGEEHFSKVAGLCVERRHYSPLDIRSCVLRYWQLIESLFEPKVPSVTQFRENELGEVVADSGDISFGALDPSVGNGLLAGALSYIDALPDNGGAIALRDAELAWRRLKMAITRPSPLDLRCLDVGFRSVDFGRFEAVEVVSAPKKRRLGARLASIKLQLWREGAIVREFPLLRHALLPLIGAVQSLRGFSKGM